MRLGTRCRSLDNRCSALSADNVRGPVFNFASVYRSSVLAQGALREEIRDLQADRDAWHSKHDASMLERDCAAKAFDSRITFMERENVSFLAAWLRVLLMSYCR